MPNKKHPNRTEYSLVELDRECKTVKVVLARPTALEASVTVSCIAYLTVEFHHRSCGNYNCCPQQRSRRSQSTRCPDSRPARLPLYRVSQPPPREEMFGHVTEPLYCRMMNVSRVERQARMGHAADVGLSRSVVLPGEQPSGTPCRVFATSGCVWTAQSAISASHCECNN